VHGAGLSSMEDVLATSPEVDALITSPCEAVDDDGICLFLFKIGNLSSIRFRTLGVQMKWVKIYIPVTKLMKSVNTQRAALL